MAEEIEAHEQWMDFYLGAFFELDTDRRDGRMPIPWSSMDRYARRHGIEGRDFEIFKDLVRALDRAAMDRKGNGDSGGVQQEDGGPGGQG